METGDIIYIFLALLLVLSLIGLLAALAKHYGLDKRFSGIGKRSGRLEVKDSLMLDARRRVVLLAHDEQEHLILLGTAQETLLSTRERKKDA